jgi:serine phosphatase RsbU (regulator of sigma subunit)
MMQADMLDRFSASIPSAENTIDQDVKEYILWQGGQVGMDFIPDASDDVAIRTYLLDCHIQGTTDPVLNRIRSSLKYFYTWLTINDHIDENPFNKFNLKWPLITQKHIQARHEAFAGPSADQELARLRALNRLGESTNRAVDVRSMLNSALDTLLEEMSLGTAWISLKLSSGFIDQPNQEPPVHGYVLAASHHLPPSLEQSDRLYLRQPPACNCQKLLNSGRLKRGVNIVECSRLQEAAKTGSETNDLMFHASVPIICNDQSIGVMNIAAEDWRLLSASDLQFLTAGARQIGGALERARLYDQIHTKHTHLNRELTMARKVQVSLLPENMPRIHGYSLAAFWKPAYETSGDYYNIYKLPGGRWGFIIADVSDKGAPAALYMALLHGLIRDRVDPETSPAALLAQLNKAIYNLDIKTNFVTSFYAILDPANSILIYSLAGHPPPLLRRVSGQVETLEGKGVALGIIPDAQYDDKEISLAPGETLVTFTDGMTDANNPASELFELEHLKTVVALAPASGNGMVKYLKNSLEAWVKEAPNYDDVTLLVIGRK